MSVWLVWFVLKVSRPRLSPGGRGTTESVCSHSMIPFVIFIDVTIFYNCYFGFVCLCLCRWALYTEHTLHPGGFPSLLYNLQLKIYPHCWFMVPGTAFIGPKWKANKVFIDTYITSHYALRLVKILYPVLPLGDRSGNSLHSTLVLCH